MYNLTMLEGERPLVRISEENTSSYLDFYTTFQGFHSIEDLDIEFQDWLQMKFKELMENYELI